MSKVLFLNQPSVGHLNPLLSIATQMKDDGHSVHFLVPGMRFPKTGIQILDVAFTLPERIRSNGLGVELISPSLAVLWVGLFLPNQTGHDETVYAVRVMEAGLVHYTRQVVKYLERQRPDVVVTDFAFLASGLAAEIVGIPYATVYHSGLPFHGEGVPPFGSGLPIGSASDAPAYRTAQAKETRMLQRLNDTVNSVRRKFGLPPRTEDVLRVPYSPWLNLVATVEQAEVPRPHLPANTLMIGPCFGKRGGGGTFPYDRLNPNAYKVYVSLGTVFNNKPWVFQKILAGLNSPQYQVIISAGGAYSALTRGQLPTNALVFASVPQVDLLPCIDLFVTHGGNNSVNEALVAGRPMLVLPIGGEQGDNASRILYLDVGDRLDITTFDAAQLRTTVEAIRIRTDLRERSAKIQQAIAATQGMQTASRCIDWLARRRVSLNRPPMCPVTITPAQWAGLL